MKETEVKALNGFTALSNEELEMVDGGGKLKEVCHAVVVASCGVVGGLSDQRADRLVLHAELLQEPQLVNIFGNPLWRIKRWKSF